MTQINADKDIKDQETYKIIGAAMAVPINYLKASGLNRVLLINFGARQLQHKRLVFNLRHLRINHLWIYKLADAWQNDSMRKRKGTDFKVCPR